MDGCVTYSGQGKVAGTAIAAVAAEVAALALGWKGRGWEAAPAQAASLGAFWGEACPWAEIQSESLSGLQASSFSCQGVQRRSVHCWACCP